MRVNRFASSLMYLCEEQSGREGKRGEGVSEWDQARTHARKHA